MADDKEVLIVDDSEENVAFMQEILEDLGHSYRVARNGKEGMQALQEKRPDLVLLDVMMPRKSGVKVFQEMKRDPELAKIPIIIVTGLGEVTGVDIETGKEEAKESYDDDIVRRFGAALRKQLSGLTPDALVEKPIDPPLLAAKIKEFLP
jgi:twitching motility two-component system response regulator PilH